jgi:dihydroflavonol-4-reductase
MMSNVFLTGANGHLGANVTRELLRRGHQVVAMVRKTSDLRSLAGLDVHLHVGDIHDRDSLFEGMAGCDAVIHTASDYSLWAKEDAITYSSTISGTENVLRAAQDRGIQRVVYTSSSTTVGSRREPGKPLTEADWNETPRTAYYTAKVQAERLAKKLAEELALEIIILLPGMLLGPYDYKLTNSHRAWVTILNGEGFVWDGTIGYLHVEDAARLHVDSLTMGTPGERYLLNARSVHLNEVRDIVERLFDIRMPKMGIPMPVGKSIGFLLDKVSNLTGKPPLFDHRLFEDFMSGHFDYDNSKSLATFGIEYQPVETIFRDTTAWLVHMGFLKPKAEARFRPHFPPRPEWR